ncbi:MAG: hypothetical protein LC772_08800, partial [Chloroflexi bacterium]|nr:hypothetical protein [Chloroflexota bacterium]
MTARTSAGKLARAPFLCSLPLALVAALVLLTVSGSELSAAQTPPAPHDPAVAAAVAKVRAWYSASVGDGTDRLDDWKFHKGDTPDGASPILDTSTWSAIRVGDEWGPENSVAWFRRDVVIPATIAGAPTAGGKIILNLAVDDDGVAYVDGRQVQAFHWDEGHVVLTDHARPGAHFFVAIKGINAPGTGRLFRADLTLSGLPTPRTSAQNYLDSETFTTWMEGNAPQIAPGLAEQERRAAAEIPPGPLASVDPKALTADFDRATSDLADPAARRITDNLVGYAHT